jgi:hypothetical protein
MTGARHMQFGNEEALVDLIVTKVAIIKENWSYFLCPIIRNCR